MINFFIYELFYHNKFSTKYNIIDIMFYIHDKFKIKKFNIIDIILKEWYKLKNLSELPLNTAGYIDNLECVRKH